MNIMGTLTSTVCQKEEKVWVCLKELQGQGGLGVSSHRVVFRFVAFPVSIPADTSRLTEEGFLHPTQGTTRKKSVRVHDVPQHDLNSPGTIVPVLHTQTRGP
uniref:Uncharacterized protein n=1 Tax=Poecilia latipinna TaxID=48699 RepID=A0A3B3W049_9TELE